MLIALASGPVAAAETDAHKFFGDARFAYAVSERETRESESLPREDDLRLRLRLGAETRLSEEWKMRGRLAGRFSTEQDSSRFWLKAWAPTRTGLELGDATIDELYLDYVPAGGNWSLRAGRFQGKFALKGIASKSFDRNNSPNTDINWTDGLHFTYGTNSTWRSHLVLQSNASNGSGQVARAPLTFDDNSSHITMFAAVEAAEPLGSITQRLFTVTYMPSTLATDGLEAPARDDYLAFTAKLFAEWPVGPDAWRPWRRVRLRPGHAVRVTLRPRRHGQRRRYRMAGLSEPVGLRARTRHRLRARRSHDRLVAVAGLPQ